MEARGDMPSLKKRNKTPEISGKFQCFENAHISLPYKVCL